MLTIYNTANHRKEEFKPVHEGEVRFYGCGPTIYNYAHIGNMRAFVFYDLLNRYLRYKGYKVTFCMNLTDIDDKAIDRMVASGEPMDKAGAYAIQGMAGVYITKINGDYNSVIGLPVGRVINEIKAMGVSI